MPVTLNIFQHRLHEYCCSGANASLRRGTMSDEPFHAHHFDPPQGPVILSVPHAGRAYDAAVLTALRVPQSSILPLEDRYADRLVDAAVAARVPTIIANIPRLMIDLNRAPDDIDPDAVQGGYGRGVPATPKARAGLGVIPTRLWGVGALWQTALKPTVIADRVEAIHAPYHAAISTALHKARQNHGSALLIDVHSMPPVNGDDAPDIVIGDRFGKSAVAQVTALAEALFRDLGFRVAVNAPYAGGYVVSRHAAPHAGIHALQIELDRRLYLDAALDQPALGLARVQAAVLTAVERLREALPGQFAAAAE